MDFLVHLELLRKELDLMRLSETYLPGTKGFISWNEGAKDWEKSIRWLKSCNTDVSTIKYPRFISR